jgi:hypothetical protein
MNIATRNLEKLKPEGLFFKRKKQCSVGDILIQGIKRRVSVNPGAFVKFCSMI